MKPEKRSLTITAQVEEAKIRLAQVDPALADIANELKKILSSDTFDNSALSEIEKKETALTREAVYLSQRILLLEDQREKAETDEAQEQLDLLPAETEKLRIECESVMEHVNAALAALSEQVRRLGEVHRQHRSLTHQNAYLDERYENTARHPLIQLPEAPNFIDLGNKLLHVFAATADGGRLTEWEQRRREWANAGRKRPALRQVA